MSTNDRPKVSVLMVTYNRERFIAQAIESALTQTTDFEYEIVVADDGSSDGTRAVVEKFLKEHPHRIRGFLRPRNLGPTKLGLQGRNNFVATYWECRGEYAESE